MRGPGVAGLLLEEDFSCLRVVEVVDHVGLITCERMIYRHGVLDLQKTFPDVPCVSQIVGGPLLRLGIPRGLSIPSGSWTGGKNTVGMSTAY